MLFFFFLLEGDQFAAKNQTVQVHQRLQEKRKFDLSLLKISTI